MADHLLEWVFVALADWVCGLELHHCGNTLATRPIAPNKLLAKHEYTYLYIYGLLVYDPILKFRRESICMTAAGFIFNSLRRFTQILREMINDESFCLNTRR